LITLIDRYEETHYSIAEPNPIQAIRFMMDQMSVDDAELCEILKSRSKPQIAMNFKKK